MKRLWGALGLVLALSVFMPRVAEAQPSQDGRERRAGASLGQNYPNPFNPETRIPFSVGDAPTCSQPGRQDRVSLKIYNVLSDVVATPVLQGGTSGVAGGQPLEKIAVPCGDYVAYWDGKVQATGREAASGVYLYRLEVDGVPLVKKMIVVK
ncbi:hypothetical protein [Gemmatimonas sp.]|uniref:hypothetical protein n=1 Tax=Gemmatimonas sp. TaxID=1962908 RepID=UPI00391F6A0A